MTLVPVRGYAGQAVQALQWCRNGRYPDAHLQRAITESANHLASCRVKELASFCCTLQDIPDGTEHGDDRVRWRFAFHSSPFVRFIWVNFVLAQQVNSFSPGAKLVIETTTPATFGEAAWDWGNVATLSNVGPDAFGVGASTLVDSGAAMLVTPDTDFYGTFVDTGSGRLIAANVYEWSLLPDTDNGYLPTGFAQGSPIYDKDRYDLAAMARLMWRSQAAHLWNWASDYDDVSPQNASTTDKNVIDTSITSVTTSSPGATLDLQYRSTRRRAGVVPCAFKAYGKCTSSGDGRMYLKDSTGATLATLNGFTSTDGWVGTTVDLPASVAKYDVHFEALSGTMHARAFSLYQHEP